VVIITAPTFATKALAEVVLKQSSMRLAVLAVEPASIRPNRAGLAHQSVPTSALDNKIAGILLLITPATKMTNLALRVRFL
jgi:hypothetical protein